MKDRQIGAKARGDWDEVRKCQLGITQLTHKYKELCDVSGLPSKAVRMSVSGYKRTAVAKIKNIKKKTLGRADIINNLNKKNIKIDDSILQLKDTQLINRNLEQLDNLSNKYNHNKFSTDELFVEAKTKNAALGTSYYLTHKIELNKKLFSDKNELVRIEDKSQSLKWHNPIGKENYDIYTITHEYGHIYEYEYFKEQLFKNKILPSKATRKQRRIVDGQLRDELVDKAIKKLNTKIGRKEFKEKYWGGYARSTNNFEWFAETFTECELGNQNNVWIETFKEWLDDFRK